MLNTINDEDVETCDFLSEHFPEAARTTSPIDLPKPGVTILVGRQDGGCDFPIRPSMVFPYYDPGTGGLIGCNLRVDGVGRKRFFFVRPKEKTRGGVADWILNWPKDLTPLYGLHRLIWHPDSPLLIVEGEKAANAAYRLTGLPTITWLGGVGNVAHADWPRIVDREVILWPDADRKSDEFGCLKPRDKQPGWMAMATVAQQLQRKNKKVKIMNIEILNNVSDGFDAADAQQLGWTPAQTLSFVDEAAEVFSLPQDIQDSRIHETEIKYDFGNFQMKSDGLFHNNTKIASNFKAKARTSDRRGEDSGLWLEWNDLYGDTHDHIISLGELFANPTAVKKQLVSRQFYIKPKMYDNLLQYLQLLKVENKKTLVDKVGWHDLTYVTPLKNYGAQDNLVYRDSNQEEITMPTCSLQDWQDKVGQYGIGNSRIALLIGLALVAPLRHQFGARGGIGIHIYGNSSTGKTTAALVAASVAGAKTKSWRTTDNALEATALQHNDGFLVLDEISQVSSSVAGDIIYMLGNGETKGRASKDGTARPAKSFRIAYASTGEYPLSQKLAEVGKSQAAGQAVRLIELPANGRYGIFDNIHGFPDGGALSSHLHHMVQQYSGIALDLFLTKYCTNLSANTERLQSLRQKWLSENCPRGSDGQVQRVAENFAHIYAALVLANELEILNWPSHEADNATRKCFLDWIACRGGTKSFEAQQAIIQVRDFLERNESRFVSLILAKNENAIIPQNHAGYKEIKKDDGCQWFYALSTIWTHEICKGLNATFVAKVLAGLGVLDQSKSSSRSASKSLYVTTAHKPRAYYINLTRLQELDFDDGSNSTGTVFD